MPCKLGTSRQAFGSRKLGTSQTSCSVNLKNILVVLILIIGLSGVGNASSPVYASSAGTYYASSYGNDDAYIYVTSGTYYAEISAYGRVYMGNVSGALGSAYWCQSLTTYSQGNLKYDDSDCEHETNIDTGGACFWFYTPTNYLHTTQQYVGTASSTYFRAKSYDYSASDMFECTPYRFHELTVTLHTLPPVEINGTTACINNVDKYLWVNSNWSYIESDDTSADNYYEFDIFNNTDYKLVFDDDHEYSFTCTGSNISYDYDDCSHTQYRFEESCGNLIPDSEGYYCIDWIGGGGICRDFYAPSGILDVSNESCAAIKIYTNSFIGQKWWYVSPVLDNHTYNCINTGIDWGLKVIVQNGSDSTLIDDAMVRVNQSCYCTHEGCVINSDQSCTCGGTTVRQKKSVNGTVSFGEMSLQDASLWVMKTGYKALDRNSTEYSTLLSGRSNFSSKTWIVKLAPDGDANESDFYEVTNKVDIHFRNEDGNRTSKILDTDTEVYLYYENNNSEEETMTLKFQSSSTHTHFIDEQSWTVAYDDIGHKTIVNSYFTPWNYAYRAVIYNSSIYGWNLTIPLTVRNGTKEEDQHYGNLTTNLWFMFEADGKIDYREDMEIVSHAGSNNTTLMNIDLEIWKDGALLCYKNLTVTDYAGADFPYYYIYEPVYDYVSGSNYTAKMYGFDRTLLEVRYLECMTDNITRKNKLTIGVKDRTGANLDNCYIYLEDWGSLPTGSNYYNAYEGIDNGYYRYKASKSGYSGTGWADITLSDDDEIVWYTLTEDYTNTSATQQKLTDDDIKGIFFPLMFFLLICIVFGGFKYVSH